jgi:hypothetical protein
LTALLRVARALGDPGGLGFVTVTALVVAFAAAVYALLTGIYTTTSGVVLETVVVILPAWSIVSLSMGLAALRSTGERR